MRKTLKIAFLCASTLAVSAPSAGDLPPASDYYYCAHFYYWADTTLKDPPASMKNHFATSLRAFKAGGDILSGGAYGQVDSDAALESLKATIKKASEEKMGLGDFYVSLNDACLEKHRRYTPAVLEESRRASASQ